MENTFEKNVQKIAERLNPEQYIAVQQILSALAKDYSDKATASIGTEQIKSAAVHDACRSFADELLKHNPGLISQS